MPLPQASLSADELLFLDEAALYLERPSFLIKVADFVGQPAERLLKLLPERAHAMVSQIAQAALERAFGVAVRSLSSRWPLLGRVETGRRPATARGPDRDHRRRGGAVWLAGRGGRDSDHDHPDDALDRRDRQARTESDLSDPETLMQCLAVFSYGSPKLEAMESAFLSWRVAMAAAVSEAAAYIAVHGAGGIAHSAAPALVQFLNTIAARFQIVISDKLAAEAVPVAGAVSGSLINAAFTDHFNRVAEFHFGILRLERAHGAEAVQAAYRQAVERAGRRAEKRPCNKPSRRRARAKRRRGHALAAHRLA